MSEYTDEQLSAMSIEDRYAAIKEGIKRQYLLTRQINEMFDKPLTMLDLMERYYPDKKGTIKRMRTKFISEYAEIDMRKQEREEMRKHGIYYASVPEGMGFSVALPVCWLPCSKEKITRGVEKLREHVGGLLPVRLDNDSIIFPWFPFTTIRSQIELCTAFVQALIRDISADVDILKGMVPEG
jgi:hypothetical protein